MIEHIIGGNLLMLFILMILYLPWRLTSLSIKIAERLKPGIWYSRPIKKNCYDREQIAILWCALLFGAGAWGGMVYTYPWLISLWK